MILVAGKRRSLLMAGDDNEMFMPKRLNVTPKTTEQHLIVRSGKSEAEVTIIKDCTRGITLLKLTTDGHKALRGLSATAELLVVTLQLCLQLSCNHFYLLPTTVKRLQANCRETTCNSCGIIPSTVAAPRIWAQV